MSITEFLTARLEEREDLLRSEGTSWSHRDYHPDDAVGTFSPRCPACVAGWPGRDEALADIAVKQAIVKMHGEDAPACYWSHDSMATHEPGEACNTLRILSLPYEDHPDFDPAWKRLV